MVDGNGIHSTRLAICGCREMPPNKIRQLMRARLFPATTKDPHTAFTVNMLKEFHLHNLESKKAAYDYLGAIRRLSDNSFTADVSVCLMAQLFSEPYEISVRIPTLPFSVLCACSIF